MKLSQLDYNSSFLCSTREALNESVWSQAIKRGGAITWATTGNRLLDGLDDALDIKLNREIRLRLQTHCNYCK